MTRRYRFLTKNLVYDALNKLRAAFLAAKDGGEVEEIIMGLLTHDERMKLGRRIAISKMISKGKTFHEIAKELKVGKTTIMLVHRKMTQNPLCYELINSREVKTENEFEKKAYVKVGGPKKLLKKTEYTGFTRKDVKR